MLRQVCGGLAAVAILVGGCAWHEAGYVASAEREIREILESKRHDAVGRWQKNAKIPKPAKEPEPVQAKAGGKVRVLSLRGALKVATKNNRNFQSQIETLHLAALSASLQRRNFGPIIDNTISYVFSNSPSTTATGAFSAGIGVSKILPSGGTIDASTTGTIDDDYEGGGATTYGHGISVTFEQPLLRGFGREVAYETLTQAERNVVYALRDFELFRQDFSIDVLRKYYGILRQKQVAENSRQTLERFTFLKRRSEALFDIGKVSAIDKFRAAQEELTARNNLITEEETLASLVDDFKIFLGLPTAAGLDIEDVRPKMQAANIDLKSAIAAAVYNRLDLRTSAQRLEDAERGVRNARNGLLPELGLTASLGLAGTKVGGDRVPYEGAHSVGIALTLPLDKTADRNAYMRALIERRRRERALTLDTDNVKLNVLNTYRRLRRLATSVKIQDANVKLADRRVKNAELRFQLGQLGNRDVVEAQAAKLGAQNALIRAILDYEIARLQLKRDIGILFLDPDGVWKE